MPRKQPGRADSLRIAIAQEAARLMVESGIQDFLLAKRKAAERFGVSEGSALPRNTEIEAALVAYQRLFGGGLHSSNLRMLREAALRAMQLLTAYQPRLVGPVLAGTATANSDVQLHLFCDRPETLHILLLEKHLPFEIVERRLRYQTDRYVQAPGLRFEIAEVTVEALLLGLDDIRQAPVSPVDGKPMRRADISDVQALLASTA
jgi:hypothetical protein